MRKTFWEYYPPAADEIKFLWENCSFVFDANILLNFYRYSSETIESLFSILQQLSDRIWLPFQAAQEYHRNRIKVILGQRKYYDGVEKCLFDAKERLIGDLRKYRRHSFLEIDNIIKRIERLFSSAIKETKTSRKKDSDLVVGDHLMEMITRLFDGKIGNPFDEESLKKIYKEGAHRYEQEIPPGYKDHKSKREKPESERYGDLLLWEEIILKSKNENVPIIFVTDEEKEDWWWKEEGKTIGPRLELLAEFHRKTNHKIYMYRMARFMEYAREFLHLEKTVSFLRSIEEVQELEEKLLKLYREFQDTGFVPPFARLRFSPDELPVEKEYTPEHAIKTELIYPLSDSLTGLEPSKESTEESLHSALEHNKLEK